MTETVSKIPKHPKNLKELREVLDALGIEPKEYDLIPPFRRQVFPSGDKWELD